MKGATVLTPPVPRVLAPSRTAPDLRDVKGQESAKRALEIAAAGGHNLLMIGPPGAGKSMLAARLPGLLPPLDAREALEISLIQSLAGQLEGGAISRARPFRNPHHSASMAALVGGGLKVKPGEVSLAHLGVLFLDELPEFARAVLDSLRQPIESGEAVVARANAHVKYPARFQLVAAMNPCRCGYLSDPARGCGRAPKCALDYQSRISGPLFDRIDLHIDVAAVSAADLSLPPPAEGSAEMAARVAAARTLQRERLAPHGLRTNAQAEGEVLEAIAAPDEAGRKLLTGAAERMQLSARGYHRVLKVARTIADLGGAEGVGKAHIAEALSYRRTAQL
jgi:magnesium chelatase family protein